MLLLAKDKGRDEGDGVLGGSEREGKARVEMSVGAMTGNETE